MASTQQQPDHQWYPDTGSTSHLTNDLLNLNIRADEYTGNEQIRVGNGQGLRIHHTGLASLKSPHNTFYLPSLLHVPAIQKNLISVNQFTTDNNVFLEFHPRFFCVKDIPTRRLLLHGPSKEGLYPWPSKHSPPASELAAFVGERASVDQWHNRLGHPALSIVRKVLASNKLPVYSSKATAVCSSCQMGKSHRLHFSNSLSRSSRPLQLLFLDVWGPSPMPSINNNRYYLCIVDDYSKYTWLFPINMKSDVTNVFLRFKTMVENFFSYNIASVQSDNGGEFLPLHNKLTSIGVSYRFSCPHTHHQMGSVERKHRHIVDTGLALLAHASAPLSLWDDAFQTSCYLINRLPSPVTKNRTPFEILFQNPPDYQFLKTFGCECWPFLRPYNNNKFSFRSQSCVFIGYSKNHHGYKCLNIKSGRVYIARHVIFNESSFPFAKSTPSKSAPSQIVIIPPVPSHSISADSTSAMSEPVVNSNQDIPSPPPSPPSVASSDSPSLPVDQPRVHPMTTRSQNQIYKPKSFSDGTVRYPAPTALTASLSKSEVEPTCFSSAVKYFEWRTAMNKEFDALLQNGTWTLVPTSPSMNIVGCKWVFRIKRKADGSIERYKARLVAKGFHQQPGIDFGETYSPVVKPITIRTVLTIAVTAGWPIHQIDVSNAFLHGVLQEDVYMSQPPGFAHPKFPNAVCKLRKALYGLKQAPRAWFSRLSTRLHELGFHGSKSDSSLFILRNTTLVIYVLIYVDDIIITSPNRGAISQLIQDLHSEFALKDLGPLHFFLGVEATWENGGLRLSQQRYINDLLNKTNMSQAKPIGSPMSSSAVLSKFMGNTMTDPSLYRSTVGSLQYLSLTRPDIGFAVNKVSQFMQDPRDVHWSAVKRILRYLKGSFDHGLYIHKDSTSALVAFSDSDWAGCPDDRRSTSGYCIFLGRNLLTWSSKKQPTVSRSSTESEYKALANTTAELIWLQSLFGELGIPLSRAPILHCDNIGATYLTSNPMFHARTKHIAIDYHFVRDRVAAKQLEVKFLSSKDQTADILTKPLATLRFTLLKTKLNVQQSTLSLRGRIGSHEDKHEVRISNEDKVLDEDKATDQDKHEVRISNEDKALDDG
jgi:hypothetical protein